MVYAVSVYTKLRVFVAEAFISSQILSDGPLIPTSSSSSFGFVKVANLFAVLT
jgi:hypothetical protein